MSVFKNFVDYVTVPYSHFHLILAIALCHLVVIHVLNRPLSNLFLEAPALWIFILSWFTSHKNTNRHQATTLKLPLWTASVELFFFFFSLSCHKVLTGRWGYTLCNQLVVSTINIRWAQLPVVRACPRVPSTLSGPDLREVPRHNSSSHSGVQQSLWCFSDPTHPRPSRSQPPSL